MSSFDVNAIREQLVQALSREFDCTRNVSIYGAGGASALAGPSFEEIGVDKIKYFIDDTPGKAGTLFHDKPVISLAEAHEKCKSHLILVSCHTQQARRIMLGSLEEDPIDSVETGTLDEYVYCKNSSNILTVFDMLDDDHSKATYANVILVRMGKAQMDSELVYKGKAYFALPQFEQIVYPDVFVDLGAYVGDTLEKCMLTCEGSFLKIFAFEPDKNMFGALQARAERLRREWGLTDDRLILVNAGVGDEDSKLSFHTDMTAAKLGGTFQNVGDERRSVQTQPIYSLDSYFSKQRVSFIKADIEGYEYPMLLGAKNVIKRDKPKLAFSIYHNAVDMFRLALKVKELNNNYKLAIRQHQYIPQDTVLYAYDENNCVMY